MNLLQQTILDQLEIKCDPLGRAAYLFAQSKNSVIDTDTGTVVAGPSFERTALPATDPRAIALLGEIPAQAIANLQAA